MVAQNKYNVALTFSNPLGSMNKYGGGVEHRWGNFAYMASYYRYIGAYYGASSDIDMRIYMRNRWIITRRKWFYQNFIYWRGFYGIAGFDGNKLAVFGYPKDVFWQEELYYGVSAGWGRRYNHGPLFVAMKVGLRATKIYDLDPDAKSLYKLFYITGPGSIAEFNIQCGIQIR